MIKSLNGYMMWSRARFFRPMLVVILLVIAAGSLVSAQSPGVRFVPDSSLVPPGDTFDIDIVISGDVAGIHCFKLGFEYDTSLAKLIEITEGALLPTGGLTFFFWDSLRSPMEIGNCILGNGLNVDGPGVLATLRFVAGTETGICDLQLPYLAVSDVNLDSMNVQPLNGVVFIGYPASPVITSAPVVTGTIGVPYYYDVNATGFPPPTYVLVDGPVGMTIDPATGEINWMPTSVGNHQVIVQAVNQIGSYVQSFTIAISQAPATPNIYTTPVTVGTVGQSYSYDVDATGFPNPTYSLTVFPTGMTVNSGTGLISWLPASTGDFDVTVVATNMEGSDSQSFTISVNKAPVITSIPDTLALAGDLYAYDVDATGLPAPTFALITYPSGMTINGLTGEIEWIPGALGNYSVEVEASNIGGTDTQAFVIHVIAEGQAPAITSTPVISAIQGVNYSYDVAATGLPTPMYRFITHPGGMTIDSLTGLIMWMPSSTGNFNVIVEAYNSIGTDQQSYLITVVAQQAPFITSTPPTIASLGSTYQYDVNATGLPAPHYSLDTYPAGMTIDSLTGLIVWDPVAIGDYDVVVRAYNPAGSYTQGYQIEVIESFSAPLITTTPSTIGELGVPYYYNVDATGYPTPFYDLSIAPSGMTIDTVTGEINWTPSAFGSFAVGVVAHNSVGVANQGFTIVVSCCGVYTSGFTGNTDCSPDGKRNLADITRLIDRVYISKNPLCCEESGNVDGDVDAKINLADITRLIDHVYISKQETAPCE